MNGRRDRGEGQRLSLGAKIYADQTVELIVLPELGLGLEFRLLERITGTAWAPLASRLANTKLRRKALIGGACSFLYRESCATGQ